jgi:hypothetical protein
MPLILDSSEAALRWLNGETRLYEDGARVRVRAEGPEQLSMQF